MVASMIIRPYASADYEEWRRMRTALWADQTDQDMTEWLGRADATVLVAQRTGLGSSLCGFLEIGTRSYAEGCVPGSVAYVEGWYVDPDLRGRGVGSDLMRAAEAWARRRGHREIASDTGLDNEPSQRAHERLGFVEADRVVIYRKDL